MTQRSRPPICASMPARNSSPVALVQCAWCWHRSRQRPCSGAGRSRARAWSSRRRWFLSGQCVAESPSCLPPNEPPTSPGGIKRMGPQMWRWSDVSGGKHGHH
jgi:hypothetical protein